MFRNHNATDKLALLELSDKLKNVAAACKATGFSRDSYYRIKKAYDEGGVEALRSRRRKVPYQTKKRIPDTLKNAVISVSLKNPLLGKHKISEILGRQGVRISAANVKNVWQHHDMMTLEDRVGMLFERISGSGEVLSKAQLAACRKAIKKRAASKDGQEAIEVKEGSFEGRLRFEALISDVSTRFINLPADQIDEEIEKSQERVCQALGFHGSGLSELTPDRKALVIRHRWRAPGLSTLYPHEIIKEDFLAYLMDHLENKKIFMFSDYRELPDAGEVVKQIAREIGATSVLVFPLKVGPDIMGLISWESYGIRVDWVDELIEQLRLISEAFINAISRKRADEALARSIAEIKKLKDRLEAENLYLIDEIRDEFSHHKIVGQSRAVQKVISQIEQVAGTSATVLIQGETGTGKEVIARAIHNLSSRRDHPMVKVNCSALPATLIESELFGHEKGAYSGAVLKQVGRFELADGSTIFLDEIGDLPLELQPKLLRVLQEGQFERLGSSKTITVDARVIAATNRDLTRAVNEGRFRSDLYYRLNIFPISIAPLRERVEDIPLLIKAFVREFSELMGKEIDTIPNKIIEALQSYDWPGNIRELRNMVERAMIITKGKTLRIQLPETSEIETTRIETLDNIQRRHILTALEKSGWRVSGTRGAARLLGINSKTLQSRIKRLGIRRDPSYY